MIQFSSEPTKPNRKAEPDEANQPWLSILLDTYEIFDSGAKLEREAEEKKRGKAVACASGCCSCCLRPSAPLSE
jgi:hypothetical protein